MRMSFSCASFEVEESTGMSPVKRIKDWMIHNRKQIWTLLIVGLLIIGCLFISKLPRYIDVYKYRLNAEVSMMNDDLKGALVSLEKAYELIPDESLESEIERLNQLIKSKSNFLRGQQSEKDGHYDTAHYYYNKVDPIDEERYQLAQDKLPIMAEKVVEDIYQQVDRYYENHLYLLMIGKLEIALQYNVRMEETLEKMDYYKGILYQNYIDKAQEEARIYCDDAMFYKLFITSIEDALKYVTTDEQKVYALQLKAELIKTNIQQYLILARQAHENGDDIVAKRYIEQILTLDETNQDALYLLDELTVTQ